MQPKHVLDPIGFAIDHSVAQLLPLYHLAQALQAEGPAPASAKLIATLAAGGAPPTFKDGGQFPSVPGLLLPYHMAT